MQYSETNKPGLADPSWYEWSVGQQYIIDMLNDDNKIKSVELQANVALGLDDVVTIKNGYNNGLIIGWAQVDWFGKIRFLNGIKPLKHFWRLKTVMIKIMILICLLFSRRYVGP